ncbi:4-hydroxy-tetrahydrodipicolinate synthase [Phytophthora nicotianae]|uniref:4-hydroxy-tetrahydrodipicolinate synthase n=1 Tax=Phytophthora nicotianae TaxID=4792 RepID=A0A0W8DIL7_PHYNI|nr:4-hydroxy-tetrahydrodipicolinate synthase [Phytophthora nicotianae]
MSLRQRDFSSSGVSSRNMFTCSEETNFLSSSGRVSQTAPSPSTRSYFSSSSSRSTFSKSRTSVEHKSEDDALLALAAKARAKVEHAQEVFATAGWKERKDGQGVRLFERKSTPARNSDDFNATMVALAGDAFSYAVTLREVPTSSSNVHLTTKRMQFSGSIPLVSSAKTFEFLDYVEFDYRTRTAVRTFQKLTRDRAGRLVVGGDVLAGYVLTEQVKSHQTSVFYFGTHTVSSDEAKSRGIVKAKLKAATVREASTHALLKLAKVIRKIGDIAIRRRLGAEDTVDPSDHVGDGSCSGCGKLVKESLLRKKHVCYICGHDTCGSCSKSQDVEGLIGVIERLRVCCMCISAARHRAFDTVNETEDGRVYLLRPTFISGLSTTSTSRTASTTPSSVRTHILPATA